MKNVKGYLTILRGIELPALINKWRYLLPLFLCTIPLFFVGCTSTNIEYGELRINRISVFQSVNVRIGADALGNPIIIYGNDGGGKQAGTAIGTAAKTLLK